jgi:hypothetical protein
MGEEPEEEGKRGAENEASNDGEIESGVFAAMDDVAGEFSEAEGEFGAEVEERADEDKRRAEQEKRAAEIAEGIHKESLGHEV